MTTNLLPLLTRLHAAAPEMCDPITGRLAWAIGEYEFYFDLGDELMAQYAHIVVSGQPALAWLSDALMAECVTRGWGIEHTKTQKHRVVIYPGGLSPFYAEFGCDTLAEALLTALVAAAEAERER